MAVERGLVLRVVDRLPPLVPDRQAPIERGRRGELDDEGLVVGEVPRPPHRDVVGRPANVGAHDGRAERVHAVLATHLFDVPPKCGAVAHEPAQRVELAGRAFLRTRLGSGRGLGLREALDLQSSRLLGAPVVEELADDEGRCPIFEREPVLALALGRQEQLETAVVAEHEVFGDDVADVGDPGHDLEGQEARAAALAPDPIGRVRAQRSA